MVVRSLEEGLEETLTLHRLGVRGELRASFKDDEYGRELFEFGEEDMRSCEQVEGCESGDEVE